MYPGDGGAWELQLGGATYCSDQSAKRTVSGAIDREKQGG